MLYNNKDKFIEKRKSALEKRLLNYYVINSWWERRL
jgi:hypothetical protein